MNYCVLASGSKGNCTYIEIKDKKFLIDVGTNFLYTSNALEEINVSPSDINAVFITHLHSDHIGGLKKFVKETGVKVYLTQVMLDNLPFELENYEVFDNDIMYDDIFIETVKLSHDTPDCRGYIFNYDSKRILYITDTGYINNKYFDKITGCDAYIFESNHDVDMLMNSNRYRPLKMRILGDEGHLSNKDCAYYLSKIITNKTKRIVLAHLSEEANTPELALKETLSMISDVDVVLGNQHKRSELFEV